MIGTTRHYLLLLITGILCLVCAIALYQLVVEFKAIVPPFNLRPLYLVLIWVGVLFPLVAIVARPKKHFPAILFVFILLSTPKHFGVVSGTNSSTWREVSYGWPADYLSVQYHKGGNWSKDHNSWNPYEERNVCITWWKALLVLGTSLAGAYILIVPTKLIEMRRDNTSKGISRPADGSSNPSM